MRGRDLGGAVAEAQQALAPIITAPLSAEWSGEFEQMEQAEHRLLFVVPLSFALVIVMLYLAFFSLRDVAIVLANVVTLVCGGVLALLVMRTNFSVSAAVGFISVFGVAIMNGLILVSSIHRLRLSGSALQDAVMVGSVSRLRPMLMTILTAILGLLPAARSTRIWRSEPTTAGNRRDWRDVDVASVESTPDAGFVLRIPQATSLGRGRKIIGIISVDNGETNCAVAATRSSKIKSDWRIGPLLSNAFPHSRCSIASKIVGFARENRLIPHDPYDRYSQKWSAPSE